MNAPHIACLWSFAFRSPYITRTRAQSIHASTMHRGYLPIRCDTIRSIAYPPTTHPTPGRNNKPLLTNCFLYYYSIVQGGIFHLILTLPPEYPFKPPTLSFTTKIYHPNVSNDDKGSMCLGILRPENWKPSCKILAVLEMARGLLVEPNV